MKPRPTASWVDINLSCKILELLRIIGGGVVPQCVNTKSFLSSEI